MEAISWIIVAVILMFLALPAVKKFPVCQSIIIANLVIFLLSLYKLPLNDLAFRPSYLFTSKSYTIFTSMFLHGDFYHIFFNMLGLLFIGIPFEHEVGRKRFALVYFVTGFFATLAYSFLSPGDSYLIGASGAIFGVLGAFAASYPLKKIVLPLFMPIIIFIRLPVVAVALLYAGVESLYTLSGVTDGIAHTAHLGGFVAGGFLSPLMKVKVEKARKIEAEDFLPFVRDGREREILQKAMDADEEEVKEAWLSYLAREVRCPKCGGEVEFRDGVRCKKCGYKR
ncbi:MAG: hypothetical protein DRH15_07190 [Deltaproteobacteria bacterium]|nr:MAG: hypothetical protein DRH15_07190 [Deltaproteobacteria bacterium]